MHVIREIGFWLMIVVVFGSPALVMLYFVIGFGASALGFADNVFAEDEGFAADHPLLAGLLVLPVGFVLFTIFSIPLGLIAWLGAS